MGIEIWKDVVGYEGYYSVSNIGNIRSEKYYPGATWVGRLLSPAINHKGYFIVILCKNKHRKTKTVHNIVAEAFIGKRPNGLVINHKDTNKLNNSHDNLEYITSSENVHHAVINGCYPSMEGEENGHSKLDNDSVVIIRKLYEKGNDTLDTLAYKFNTCRTNIYFIVRRITWKHI